MAVLKLTIFQNNDQWIELSGLSDGLEPTTFFNAATVKATLRDSTNSVVSGINELTLTYVPASNGIYRGLVEDSFAAPLGGGYTLQINAIEGTAVGNWFNPVKIEIRKFITP